MATEIDVQIPEEMKFPWDRTGLSDQERMVSRYEAFQQNYGSVVPDAGPRLLRAAMAGGLSWGDFERELLREETRGLQLRLIRESRPTGPAIHGSSRGAVASSPLILEAALLKHMGRESLGVKTLGPDVMQAGADLRATSLVDIVRSGLQMQGRELPGTKDGILRAGVSTINVPGILGNVGNKLLLDAYTAFPSVARIVARRLSANDFKQHTGYRLTGDAIFERIPAEGKIPSGTLDEASFSFAVATYARMFGLSRKSLVNDDLGAFDSVTSMLGRGAAQALEDLFWTLVLANTGSFFAGGNSNYIEGATSALGLEGLGLAVTAMRKMVDSQGKPISVTPKYLVVPPELEALADSLFASENVIVSGDTDVSLPGGNSYRNKYMPLVAAHLSNDGYPGHSATGWYLFGPGDDVAAFGIGYLNDAQAPTIESANADFDELGIQFRGYHDFGVCQIDTHGAVLSKGST